MKERLLILRADIQADLQAINEIYAALDRKRQLVEEDERIVIAYYLHNLYSAFESIFQRTAEHGKLLRWSDPASSVFHQ